MKLLPAWNERLHAARPEPFSNRVRYCLKKSPQYYAMQTNFIDTLDGARAMVDFAQQRPLFRIGLDTEFRYDRPGVVIDKRNTTYDPRSIRPLLLSLAMAEPSDANGDGTLYAFVIDLRKMELLPVLEELFRLPMPFIGHFVKVELFCLWRLGLPEPSILWDTFIFEKALQMGRYHHEKRRTADDGAQILAREEAQEKEAFGLSLVVTCQRYGVTYRMAGEKERLLKSFLTHPDGAPFSQGQIDYSAEDAIAASLLYPLQVHKAVQNGLLHHCMTVEMPWVTTNARIQWMGARVDEGKRDEVFARLTLLLEQLEKQLATEYGIENTQSHKQLAEFFQECGLLHSFRQGGTVSFDKKMLKKNAHLHPAIALLRHGRRVSSLLADKLLSSEFVGDDGRVRADHQQLGTATGRQASRWPNFLGLDRMLRPLVIPDPGYGIGEVDFSQVEVGVAAAVYGDEELVRMFNSGDVYSAMAQHFYQGELSAEDRAMTGKEFKGKHKVLRNQMKTCTLGIIYGITPVGLAENLGTTTAKAAALQERFMTMFPQLQTALIAAAQFGAIRGYAHTVSGLRRYRAKSGEATRREKNWLTNHPVQGSAAVVFKAAGNRLHRLYRQYDARITIPLHDAFIFEAPLADVEAVAELTSRVMCDTLQEYFPVLRPQVEVNTCRSDCWNKDGEGDELERWINGLNALTKDQESDNSEGQNETTTVKRESIIS
jgi:DNA polymerase I